MSEFDPSKFKRHDRVGAYEIIKLLGRGGMGEAYLAKDSTLDRHVAIKIVNSELANDQEVQSRFRQEGKALARLQHPSLITVFNVGEESGIPYLVMEYVDGLSLASYLEHGTFGISEALHLMLQIVEGVAAAHKSGVIHRDLKPVNIIVDESHKIKIIDFGIARMVDSAVTGLTTAGSILGTIHYLAPEVARGQSLSVQTDIYAMGVIFYELLTGQRPFTGSSSLEILEKIKMEPIRFPVALSGLIPVSLQALILKMTAKNTNERFQSAYEVLEELKKLKFSDWPVELQTVWPRHDIENEDEVRKMLSQMGFDSGEYALIIHLACHLQSRVVLENDKTEKLSEIPAKLKLSRKALEEGIEKYKISKQKATNSISGRSEREIPKKTNRQRMAAALSLAAFVLMLGVYLFNYDGANDQTRSPASDSFGVLDDNRNYLIKAFKGPTGEMAVVIYLDPVKDRQRVLIKFLGVTGEFEGKIIPHTLESFGESQDFRMESENYVSMTLRRGQFEIYPKGLHRSIKVQYSEAESERLHPGALVREFNEIH